MFFRKFSVGSFVFCSVLAFAGVASANDDFGAADGISSHPTCQNAPMGMTLQKGDYGVSVQTVQSAIGIRPADGCFGNQTHQGVLDYQSCHGLYVDGVVGPATWRAINAGKTLTGCARNVAVSNSPSASSNSQCSYIALTRSEVERMLGMQGCDSVRAFQQAYGLKVDGIVGPATARQIILKAKNPCSIYGSFGSDCFLGIQRNGNLGTLYVVIDGQVVETMPARFGNPDRTNGKKTPEGAFRIFRSIEGDHASENCSLVNGVRAKCMRNPLYFKNGIAIHGTDKPQSPAGSLGCIGVSNSDSNTTYQYYLDGVTLVVIVDFQRGG